MKKTIIFAVIAIAILFAVNQFLPLQSTQRNTGGAVNYLSSVSTQSATNTTALWPVKILSGNTGRTYAQITNDSDTAVYLYFGTFTDPSAASTSAKVNQGIRLNATGGTYEITDQNLYVGEIWASSTASSKKILFVEN